MLVEEAALVLYCIRPTDRQVTCYRIVLYYAYRQAGQDPSPAINAAVSDLEMETEYDSPNDQLTLLKRYVIEQGAKIMTLKHKVNYLLKFIGMEQDVDDVDVDVYGNRTCLSVPAAEKWSERLIKGNIKIRR